MRPFASGIAWIAVSCQFVLADPADGQQDKALDGRDGHNLALDRFRPRSMLRVPKHPLERARFPAVDVHTHPGFRLKHSQERLDEFVRLMDRHNIALCVSLDGRLGPELDEHLRYLRDRHANRFVVFTHLDWRGNGQEDEPGTWDCQRPDFARRTATALAAAKDQGISGLKLFKRFGLEYRNPDGKLIQIDDRRWDPIWEACGRLNLPVIIHTAAGLQLTLSML